MSTTPKTGKQVIAATRRKIEVRMGGDATRAGASKRQLRDALQHCHPYILDAAMAAKGITMRSATADELHDVNYGIAWARAWGLPLSEYFNAAWGVDAAEAEPELMLMAA